MRNEIDGRVAWITIRPLIGLFPIFLFLGIFFIGPLVFNLSQSLHIGTEAPAFTQYIRILSDEFYLSVIRNTLLLAAVVTVTCALLGYPFAYAIARARGSLKSWLIFIMLAPLLVNVVIRSFGWMVLLSGNGVVNWVLEGLGLPPIALMYTWTGIAIATVHVFLPFMVLAIASGLETLDPRLEEAALVLGASRFSAFRLVTFPLSLEGLQTGSILVFTLTVGAFVTVMILGSSSTMVLPLLIYQQLTVVSDWPFAAALGVVLVLLITFILWLQARLSRANWRR